MLVVNRYPKYGPVSKIAIKGFNWNMEIAGNIHRKKCSEMLGVIQSVARKRRFHAMCCSPEIAHVCFPHNGSLRVSHNSWFFTKNKREASMSPPKNDMYKYSTIGFTVNANNHKLKNNGWKHMWMYPRMVKYRLYLFPHWLTTLYWKYWMISISAK